MALNPLKPTATVSNLHSKVLCLRFKPTASWSKRSMSSNASATSSASTDLYDATFSQTWRPSKRPQYQNRSYSCLPQRSNVVPHSSVVSSAFFKRTAIRASPLSSISRRTLVTVPGSHIKVYPPPPSARVRCKDPIGYLTQLQLAELDPNSVRTRLFSPSNPEAAKVGDILLVRTRTGDTFSGVCISIRRRGVDTAILLRNHLTRVGVEMWYKIYNPNVAGIEVVERRPKRARRARLYYMRNPKHDRGSVENVVSQYLRQRASLRSGDRSGGKGKGKSKKP